MDTPNDHLSDDLLEFAKNLGLVITSDGSALYTSTQGSGFDLDHYITSYDGMPHLEIVLDRYDECNERLGIAQMLLSDPLSDDEAREVMVRWAALMRLEDDYDKRIDAAAEKERDEVFSDLLTRLGNPKK